MKINVAVSVWFTTAALLTPAYATTGDFTVNTVLPAAYYPAPATMNLAGGTALAPSSRALQENLRLQNDLAGTAGYEVFGLLSGQVNGTGADQPAWAPKQTAAADAIDNDSLAIQYGTTTQAPEPGTFVLVGIAMIGLGMTVRERKRKA